MPLHEHLDAREPARPLVLRAIQGERIGGSRVVLVHGVEQPLLVLGRLPEGDLHPSIVRLERARPRAERPVVDRTHGRHRLVAGSKRHAAARLSVGRPSHPIQRDVEAEMVRGRREPEATVIAASEANSVMTTSPRSIACALIRSISSRRMPRRRWVGSTPTSVMPAEGERPSGYDHPL